MAEDRPSADPHDAWRRMVEALAAAGDRMAKATADAANPDERADGFRALARALANQLGRLEVDDAQPELVPFNLWRQKFYMDNPDCRYWVAEIAPGGRYRITGTARGATFVSVNVYAAAGLTADTVARATSDEMSFGADGGFSITLGGEQADAPGAWLPLPAGGNMVWVRQFFDQTPAVENYCTIVRLDPTPVPPMIEADRFTKRLSRLAPTLEMAAKSMTRTTTLEPELRNSIREWSEMTGGAVFTEPGIHYQRGAWDLAPDEALVIEGKVAPARHWSVLLYSRFFNSLDYRNRTISLTGPKVTTDADGQFRIVLAAENPGVPNWLDTEGRPFGMFVIRWLQPAATPALPTARRVKLQDLRATA